MHRQPKLLQLLAFRRFIRTRRVSEISTEEAQRLARRLQQRRMRDSQLSFPFQSEPSHNHERFMDDPVHNRPVFSDPPNENGLVTREYGIFNILREPTIVIERQVEFMNLFLGFEQANRYKIMDLLGNLIGYMEEKDFGIGKMIARQLFRLHRPFDIDIFDNNGKLLLNIKRPFSFINSHIKCFLPSYDDNDHLIFEELGESVQSWHLWRRRYNLFKLEDDNGDTFDQFGAIDAPFLSFDFPVRDREGLVIGLVDRNWVGLGRELFTDLGVYVIRMDPASFAGLGDVYPQVAGPLTVDQRAVLLATAVSIDFDYFSRHSRGGGGWFSFGSYE